MQNKTRLFLKILLGLISVVIFIGTVKVFNIQGFLGSSLEWIRGLGPAGIAVFIILYVLACVLFLPGSVLTLGAGAIFGVMKGSAIVSFASTFGAAVSFLIGRYLVRKWVESKIEGNEKFKSVDDAVAKEGWKIVGLTRLSPVFPFNLLNYAYGVTKVSFTDYVLASWIGMMPGTVMYVYLGSLAGDVASLGARGNNGTSNAAQWTLRIVGFIATVAVTVYVTWISKKALKEKI